MRLSNAAVVADVPIPPFVPGPSGTHITIRGLTKYFAGWPLYENFDLNIPKHAIVSVFGPNGCGKSTLINMIAGLIPIDSGEILFDGKSLAETKIGYVFQNYREALFPWVRTIDTPRARWAGWLRPRSAIRRCSCRWTRCTRGRTAGDR